MSHIYISLASQRFSTILHLECFPNMIARVDYVLFPEIVNDPLDLLLRVREVGLGP